MERMKIKKMITLQKITQENLDEVLDLSVTEIQKKYVASNAKSLAEALFYPEAWFRAVYADDNIVGFVMLADETQNPTAHEIPKIMLWRLMIDAKHQGKSYGRDALNLIIEYAKSLQKFNKISLSFHPGDFSPEQFYLSIGFKHSGEMNDGEHVMEFEF